MAILGTVLDEIGDERQAKRSWTVEVDGVRLETVHSVRISHPSYGVLAYGLDPAGYDGWSFHENGGGGSVIVPYVRKDGRLYVGLVRQKRVKQGGEVDNVPRGFLDGKETHFQAAHREAEEELGGKLSSTHKPVPSQGEPANPNSTFFETCGQTSDGKKEGVRFHFLEFRSEEVEPAEMGQLGFKSGVLEANPALKSKKVAEQILSSRFMTVSEACRVGDMFTIAGVARLLDHLGLV